MISHWSDCVPTLLPENMGNRVGTQSRVLWLDLME